MTEPTSNDNEPVALRKPKLPDASGQAAILLVESLIHGLVERSVITIDDAIGIVEVAGEVAQDHAVEPNHADAAAQSPMTILASISASLRFDYKGD